MDRDGRTRAGIEQHWEASERGDIDTEHAIYAADAILDYPQSGERFRGRSRIQAQRGGHPAERHFTVLRILGGGDLWVSQCIITYDGVPSYSVSVMEFTGDLVTHETQYFADPFPARSRPGGAGRADPARRGHQPGVTGRAGSQAAVWPAGSGPRGLAGDDVLEGAA